MWVPLGEYQDQFPPILMAYSSAMYFINYIITIYHHGQVSQGFLFFATCRHNYTCEHFDLPLWNCEQIHSR